MKLMLSSMLLLLPFCANATLIYVEYVGTITSSSIAEYTPGDSILGVLTIDSELAGEPDISYNSSAYGATCGCTENFITGFLDDSFPAADQVKLANRVLLQWPPSSLVDRIDIFSSQAIHTTDRKSIGITVLSPGMLDGLGLEQSIELDEDHAHPNADGTHMFGAIVESAGLLRKFASIAVSHFSMTSTAPSFSCSR